MQIWKRTISVFLVLSMVFTMLPVFALAEETEQPAQAGTVVEELTEASLVDALSEEQELPEQKSSDAYPWDGMTDEEFVDWVMAEENRVYIISLFDEDNADTYEALMERIEQIADDDTYSEVCDYLMMLYEAKDEQEKVEADTSASTTTEKYFELQTQYGTVYLLNPPANPEVTFFADSNEKSIWDFLKSQGFSDAGVAGIMGNLQAESGYAPTNLENSANNKSGMTDAEFTQAVNNGTISRDEFISSSRIGVYSNGTYGYGIAQWTYSTRKAALYDYWKSYGCSSIGDLDMQLHFMVSEMSTSLKNAMKTATNVSDACVTFHNVYEGSADTAERIAGRVQNAENIYARYSTGGSSPLSCTCSESYAGNYICTTSNVDLNIRSGHGSSFGIVGKIPKGATVYVSKASGLSAGDWGHVEYNGISGYASMEYLSRQASTPTGSVTITTSKDEISLTLGENESAQINVSITDDYTGRWTMKWAAAKNEEGNIIFSSTMGDWYNGYNSLLTITAKEAGESLFRIQVVDSTDNTVLATKYIKVVINSKKYSVAYNANGGFGAPAAQIKEHGKALTLSETIPTRSGYTFNGWATAANSTTVNYLPLGTYTDNADVTLYAIWKETKHDYAWEITKQPSKTEKGQFTFMCKTCGETTTWNGIPALDPESENYSYSTVKAATCTASGIGRYTFLKTSFGLFEWGTLTFDETIPATGHNYTYTITKNPTTTATGTLTGSCSNCSSTPTVTLPKLDTKEYTCNATKKATCQEEGYGVYTWNNKEYGEFLFQGAIPKKAHDYYIGVNSYPSLNRTGVYSKLCMECLESEDTLMPALNTVDYVFVETKGATCTEQGLGTYTWKVKPYGNTVVITETLPAKGHAYHFDITKKPTSTTSGLLVCDCDDCSYTATEILPKLDESNYSYTVVKTATVSASGVGRYTWNNTEYGQVTVDVEIPKINTYTVTYNANGGSGAPSSQVKTHNVTLVLSTVAPVRTGYTFKGWATTSSATTAQYQPGKNYTANSDATLYAVWEINKYTVTYDANGGTGAPGNQTKEYGKPLTLSTVVPTRTGYTFKGWGIVEHDTSAWSLAESEYYQPGDVYWGNADLELYAVWEIKQYTVSYDANGGTGAPASQTKTHGEDIILSAQEPTWSGHRFYGWSANPTTSGIGYRAGDVFKVDRDTTLYAKWSELCSEGHSYTYTKTKDPTATATGTLSGKCDYCNSTKEIYLPALSLGAYTREELTAATCTKTGTAQFTWKNTDFGTITVDVITAAKGHDYTKTVTKQSTVMERGTVTYSCSAGDASGTDTLPWLIPGLYDYAITEAPTCSSAGVGQYSTWLSSCGMVTFDVVIPMHDCVNVVANKPTYSQEGLLRRSCTQCEFTEDIIMPPNQYPNYVNIVKQLGDCSTNTVDDVLWENTTYGFVTFEEVGQKEHNLHGVTWTVTKNPTSEEYGTVGTHCANCGAVVEYSLERIDSHNYSYRVIREATDTEPGTGEYTFLGDTIYGAVSFEVEIPALNAEKMIASGTCGDNLTWTLDEEGTLTISGTGTMYDYTYENGLVNNRSDVLKVVMGVGVTSVGQFAFDNCNNLTAVTMPGVTEVGFAAFQGCDSLQTIYMPKVETIEDAAFNLCGFAEVTIPSGTTSIAGGAFRQCSSLLEFKVVNGNTAYCAKDGILYTVDGKTLVECPAGKSGTVTIPNGTTKIGGYAFMGCWNVTDVIIPNTVTLIDVCAFNCSGLTKINIPGSVTRIEAYAFENCTGLTSVTVPDGVTSIGQYAFADCWNLKAATVPESVETIGNCALGYGHNGATGQYEKISGFTVFGFTGSAAETYAGTNGFKFAALDDTSSVIASGTCGQNVLWSLSENGTLTLSGMGAMYEGDEASVPWRAYRDRINRVKISDGITSIRPFAFDECTHLQTVEIPKDIKKISTGAFRQCNSLQSITVSTDNETFQSIDGVLYSKDGKTLLAYPGGRYGAFIFPDGVTAVQPGALAYCSGLTGVTVPESVTTLSGSMFAYSENLMTVNLPNSLKTIEHNAFMGCKSLRSLSLPASLTEIGMVVFAGCSSLQSFDVAPQNMVFASADGVLYTKDMTEIVCCPGGRSGKFAVPDSVTTIGADAFADCTKLTEIELSSHTTLLAFEAFVGCTGVTEMVIPNKVTLIGPNAFTGSGITKIYLPVSLNSIEMWAFDGCNSIQDIFYAGTEAQWAKIDIGESNDPLKEANIHFNSPAPNDTFADITISIPGAAQAGISVTAPEGGWKEGTNTFTVSCAKPCVVAVSYDGGQTYVRLTASDSANGKSFTAENMTADTQIAVVLKGDFSGDGRVNNVDVARIKSVILKRTEADCLQALTADVTGDGRVNNVDVARIKASILRRNELVW